MATSALFAFLLAWDEFFYALLFTSTLRESELSSRVGRPVYNIGRMTARDAVQISDNGVTRPLEPRGWDHFAR